MNPLVVINAVGMTPRLLALAPRLQALAARGWAAGLQEVLPAVTCTAQATLLTGLLPQRHGIVANGWLFRDTNEVRFWQQCHRLIEGEAFYAVARRRARDRGRPFKSAKLFWWFNQGAPVDLSLTPKPHYGVDGDKVFAITGTPPRLVESIERQLGPFPFPQFWGPLAGQRSTEWIAAAAALVLLDERPDLTLVYLPHLDYDPQRYGPSGCDMKQVVKELDDAAAPLLEAAKALGAQVWLVSEYGHGDVRRALYPNRLLRTAGFLHVRPGPFGEQLDLYGSRAFAVVDHQLAHVYVPQAEDIPRVKDLLAGLPGVTRALSGEERADIHLDHPRSGEIILLAERDAWFAYPFWLEDANAPDYAPTVAIHHKPGFDPCELFFDPKIRWPKLRAARRLLQKKLGFRTRFDLVPLDGGIVKGSHGLAASDPQDRPLIVGHGRVPANPLPMTDVASLLLSALGLD